jgi:Pyruvate/2-oxoacid:ferredoxin oxidoreductase delta subunit
VGKLGIVDWREDCSSCKNCVKKGCVYGLYRDEANALHDELGYLDYIYQCKGCLTCIQNCTKNLLTRVVNPEYELLGDDYFTPKIIQETWFQAASGQIPVSGAGYGGPFSGEGFDSIWTDMSEIVRPHETASMAESTSTPAWTSAASSITSPLTATAWR